MCNNHTDLLRDNISPSERVPTMAVYDGKWPFYKYISATDHAKHKPASKGRVILWFVELITKIKCWWTYKVRSMKSK